MEGERQTNGIPVITIDGPSGSGKGTISRLLAAQLGWHFLDSGALYRLVALAALHHAVSLEDEVSLKTLAAHLDVQFVAEAFPFTAGSFIFNTSVLFSLKVGCFSSIGFVFACIIPFKLG